MSHFDPTQNPTFGQILTERPKAQQSVKLPEDVRYSPIMGLHTVNEMTETRTFEWSVFGRDTAEVSSRLTEAEAEAVTKFGFTQEQAQEVKRLWAANASRRDAAAAMSGIMGQKRVERLYKIFNDNNKLKA